MNNRRNILKLSLDAAGLLVLSQVIELAKATEDFIKGRRVKDHPIKQLSKHALDDLLTRQFPNSRKSGHDGQHNLCDYF